MLEVGQREEAQCRSPWPLGMGLTLEKEFAFVMLGGGRIGYPAPKP